MADLQSADSPAAQVIAIHSMKNPDMAMLRGLSAAAIRLGSTDARFLSTDAVT